MRFLVATMLLLASMPTFGENVQAGDFIFRYGASACSEEARIVDLASVRADGTAQFTDGTKVIVAHRSIEELHDHLASRGIHVAVVPKQDKSRMSKAVQELLASLQCSPDESRRAPDTPSYTDPDGTERASLLLPNKALHWTLDPVALFANAKSTPGSRATELGR